MSDFDKELETFNTWWERVKEFHHRMSPFQIWDNGYATGYNAGLKRAIEITTEKKENETTAD